MFNDIFNSDDKELKNLTTRLDKILISLPNNMENKFNNEDEIYGLGVKESIRLSEENKNDKKKSVVELLNDVTISNARISKYQIYDELIASIPLLKRIIKVFSDNIVQLDPITHTCLKIKENTTIYSSEKKQETKELAQEIIKFFNLDNKLVRNILNNYLKYGDGFIEIINLDDYHIDIEATNKQDNIAYTNIKLNKKTKSKEKLITEELELIKKQIIDEKHDSKDIHDKLCNILFEIVDNTKFLQEFVSDTGLENELIEITENKLKIKREKESDAKTQDENLTNRDSLKKIHLRYHKPHRIVKLINNFDNLIGYVEILEEPNTKTELDNIQTDSTTNPTKSLVSILNSLSSVQKTSKNENNLNGTIDKFIENIILNLFEKNPKFKQKIKNKKKAKELLNDDLIYSIKNLLLSIKNNNLNILRIRFIDSDSMVNCMIEPSDYYPYGQSIVDSLIQPSKLYSVVQLSNIINKLSRSSLLRKWTLETGVREDKRGLVEKFKSNLRNSTITASDLSSKNVANILSDYKDIITFTKNGTQFVNMELMNTGDPNNKDDLVDKLKNDILALSGIPSTYLGYGDVFELKEQLTNVNIQFATEISSLQKNINVLYTSLFDKIFKILEKKYLFSDFFNIILTPPAFLLIQLIEGTLTSIQNISASIKEIDPNSKIDTIMLLKKISPYIEWDELFEAGNIKVNKAKLLNPNPSEDQ